MLAGDPTEAAEKAEEFLKERSLASYYDEVALKGLQLAQADAERGALDQERLTKIRDAVSELPATFPIRRTDRRRKAINQRCRSIVCGGKRCRNAVHENLPILSKETLPPEWQGEHPVLCVAGRSLIDEAAAIMLAQLSTAHGLAARVEGAAALSTTNVFRLEPPASRSFAWSISMPVDSAHALLRSASKRSYKSYNHPGLLGQGNRPRRAGIVAGKLESRSRSRQPG